MNELDKLNRQNNLFFIVMMGLLLFALSLVLWDLYFNNIVCEYGTLNNRCMYEDEYFHLKDL